VPVDLTRAYWTPPLPPRMAFDVERNQIETVLGVAGLVALTDHDTIEAPDLLRDADETIEIPFSLEWSVPYEDAIFHLGVHNLPANRARTIVADLTAYTQHPSGARLTDLLDMLDSNPDVLIVFNHPLWNLCWLGQQRCEQVRTRFLRSTIQFLHAFELNATRSRAENNGVIELAGQWRRLLISGGTATDVSRAVRSI
jgi:predicted metal-dependent phosphoesterase TrpH